MTTRSGCSGLTKAYQSVMSAFWSRAVMGASRWLEAKSWVEGAISIDSTASDGSEHRGLIFIDESFQALVKLPIHMGLRGWKDFGFELGIEKWLLRRRERIAGA